MKDLGLIVSDNPSWTPTTNTSQELHAILRFAKILYGSIEMNSKCYHIPGRGLHTRLVHNQHETLDVSVRV